METIFEGDQRRVFTCRTCTTDVSVPTGGWNKARENRRRRIREGLERAAPERLG